MEKKILTINAGSSSLKFSLYNMPEATEIVNGYVEKIGNEDSFYTLKYNGQKEEKKTVIMNHREAIQIMIDELLKNHFVEDLSEIKGIGHRIAHGGEKYKESVIIDDGVIETCKGLTKLAKLHMGSMVDCINASKEAFPNTKMVAVFDTAFHQTMPEENYMYAVPYEWYEENSVRKYGFHGTSHKYITETMQQYLDKPNANLIICHIGSGASISCIKDGQCFDTTMGLTPLDGLIMGTRCGSIDSSIVEYICKERNLSMDEVTSILNKKSGLYGIAGKNDFRDVNNLANSGDQKAKLAIKMFENSIIKYIAQYYFELDGNVDALVFTAGIGENANNLRADVVNAISNSMGIYLNSSANDNIGRNKINQAGIITTDDSKFKVYVVPTDEESMILKDTCNVIEKSNKNNKVYKLV